VGGLRRAIAMLVGRAWCRGCWQVARTGSRELFTLSVLAVALGIAYGSAAHLRRVVRARRLLRRASC
jgi:predicted Kef-type K+ transport protein